MDAKLQGANLASANFRGANLSGTSIEKDLLLGINEINVRSLPHKR